MFLSSLCKRFTKHNRKTVVAFPPIDPEEMLKKGWSRQLVGNHYMYSRPLHPEIMEVIRLVCAPSLPHKASAINKQSESRDWTNTIPFDFPNFSRPAFFKELDGDQLNSEDEHTSSGMGS